MFVFGWFSSFYSSRCTHLDLKTEILLHRVWALHTILFSFILFMACIVEDDLSATTTTTKKKVTGICSTAVTTSVYSSVRQSKVRKYHDSGVTHQNGAIYLCGRFVAAVFSCPMILASAYLKQSSIDKCITNAFCSASRHQWPCNLYYMFESTFIQCRMQEMNNHWIKT